MPLLFLKKDRETFLVSDIPEKHGCLVISNLLYYFILKYKNKIPSQVRCQ